MYLTIVLLPLIGGILSVNRKVGTKIGSRLSIICIFITAILATIAFIEVGIGGSSVYIKLGDWLESVYLNIEWTLVFDPLTVSMLIPVTYVSALVQLYSLSYMEGDAHLSRFYSYLSLFSFFMLILITGENLLVLFVGWEGVGLVSYLLINYWYTRIAANMAAMKAFLINRVGDLGLSLGILLTIGIIGDLSFASLFSMAPYLNVDILLILSIFFIIGATAKSGQIGLSTWLPSAMEGPTPVSSLLHAATINKNKCTIINRPFSTSIETSSESQTLSPWFVTGYTDGDGTFSIRLRKADNSPFKYRLGLVYAISAENTKDNKELLKQFKKFWGFGSIGKSGDQLQFEVSSISNLLIVAEHFHKYPLQSRKIIYFEQWNKVLNLMKEDSHLTREGFIQILSIKSGFPRGLKKEIIEMYPDVNILPNHIDKFERNRTTTIDGNWIAGFTNSDGTFGLNYTASRDRFQPQFRITQKDIDIDLLEDIIITMKTGYLVKSESRDRMNTSVSNHDDLFNIIIPFFDKYNLYGTKALDYKDFRKGIFMINKKEHLTNEGKEELKRICYSMNSYRDK